MKENSTVMKEKKAVAEFLGKKTSVQEIAAKYECTAATLYRWVRKHATKGYSRKRAKMLLAYDTDGDGYISIPEYLKNHLKTSNGPDATPGNIEYHYQNLHNIFNYVYLFLDTHQLQSFVALPDAAVVVRGGVIRAACSIDIYNKNI